MYLLIFAGTQLRFEGDDDELLRDVRPETLLREAEGQMASWEASLADGGWDDAAEMGEAATLERDALIRWLPGTMATERVTVMATPHKPYLWTAWSVMLGGRKPGASSSSGAGASSSCSLSPPPASPGSSGADRAGVGDWQDDDETPSHSARHLTQQQVDDDAVSQEPIATLRRVAAFADEDHMMQTAPERDENGLVLMGEQRRDYYRALLGMRQGRPVPLAVARRERMSATAAASAAPFTPALQLEAVGGSGSESL